MDRRYDEVDGEDCPYAWLSEWLCEYVDGTMDPSVRAVFDEYLAANPELAEHVEQLCRMRSLLCGCNGSPEAKEEMRRRTEDIRKRLCRDLESEMMRTRSPLPEGAGTMMAVASGMTVMLVVGMIVGASLFGQRAAPGERAAPSAASAASELVRSDRADRADRPARSLLDRPEYASPAVAAGTLTLYTLVAPSGGLPSQTDSTQMVSVADRDVTR